MGAKAIVIEDKGLMIEDNDLMIEDKGLMIEDKAMVIEDKGLMIEDNDLMIEDNDLIIEDNGSGEGKAETEVGTAERFQRSRAELTRSDITTLRQMAKVNAVSQRFWARSRHFWARSPLVVGYLAHWFCNLLATSILRFYGGLGSPVARWT